MDELEKYDRRGENNSTFLPIVVTLFVIVGLFAAWIFWQSQQVPVASSTLSTEEYVRAVVQDDVASVPYGSVHGIVSRSKPIPMSPPASLNTPEVLVDGALPLEVLEEAALVEAASVSVAKKELATTPRDKVEWVNAVADTDVAEASSPVVLGNSTDSKTLSFGKNTVQELTETVQPLELRGAEPASSIAFEGTNQGNSVTRNIAPVSSDTGIERDYSLFTADDAWVIREPPVTRSQSRCLAAREKLDEVRLQMHTDYLPSEYRRFMGLQIKYTRAVSRYCT